MLSRRRFSSRGVLDPPDFDYAIKAILLGEMGVGKTTFLHTFLHDTCPSPSTHVGTQVDRQVGQASGHKKVHFRDKRVRLTLWDTAGQERYRSMTASYYRGAHACIIMYDVHKEQSFANVTTWLESVLDYKDTTSGTHTVLVGTVSGHNRHHRHSATHSHSSREVDRRRAETLASHYQIPYFEVDCVSDPRSVEVVMDSLVNMVMTTALENKQLSQTIRPYSVRLQQLAKKTQQAKCSACCIF